MSRRAGRTDWAAIEEAVQEVLDHARRWAAEHEGAPAGADLSSPEVYERARLDAGPRFPAAVRKLARALDAGDAMAVVLALIELGHVGRDLEVKLRFVGAARIGRQAAPRLGGKTRAAEVAVEPKVVREMLAYFHSLDGQRGAISKTARKSGLSRRTVGRYVKKSGQC